jgi:hypothetical protein
MVPESQPDRPPVDARHQMVRWFAVSAAALAWLLIACGMEFVVGSLSLTAVAIYVAWPCYLKWVERSPLSLAQSNRELKSRFLKAAAGLLVGSYIGLYFAADVIDLAKSRLEHVLKEYYDSLPEERRKKFIGTLRQNVLISGCRRSMLRPNGRHETQPGSTPGRNSREFSRVLTWSPPSPIWRSRP